MVESKASYYLAEKNFTKYVRLYCLSVCLFVTIFGDGFQAIVLKCFVCVGDWPRAATLNLFTLVDFCKIYKVLYSTLDIVFL